MRFPVAPSAGDRPAGSRGFRRRRLSCLHAGRSARARGRQRPGCLSAASGPVKQAPANAGGTDTPVPRVSRSYQQPAPADDTDTGSTPQSPTPKVASQAATQEFGADGRGDGACCSYDAACGRCTKDDQAGNAENLVGFGRRRDQAAGSARRCRKRPRPWPRRELTAITPAAQTVTAGPPATQAATGGAAALQIGAYKSEDEANDAWKAFAQEACDGQRLYVGDQEGRSGRQGCLVPFALGGLCRQEAAASTFCGKLKKADGGTCFPRQIKTGASSRPTS